LVAGVLLFPHDLGVPEREQFAVDAVGAVLSLFGPEIRAIGSPLLRAMAAGGLGNALSAAGTRATRDAFAGRMSSAGAYAEDTALGFGFGALVSGAAHGAGVGLAKLRDLRESRQVLASVTDGPIDNLGAAAPCSGGSCGTALVCFVGGTEVQTSEGPRTIESLRVGERVLSKGECPTSETDEGAWAAVHLIAPNPDAPSDPLELTVLKPWAWVEARASAQAEVELADFGIATVGTIVGVEAVDISAGAGCVVRSTITHINNDVWSLDLEGGTRLEPTGRHRFLSVDRGEWVATRDLYVGERLITAEGEVTVAGLAQEGAPRRVYNLEVESTHTYLVSGESVVTHNADCGTQQSFGFMDTMEPMRAPPDPPGSWRLSSSTPRSSWNSLLQSGISGATRFRFPEVT
jgi:hypothetical protein